MREIKEFYKQHEKTFKKLGKRLLLLVCTPLIVLDVFCALLLKVLNWSSSVTKQIDDVKRDI